MALFREESMNKISSPEQMNDYMRVTGVHVWLILGSVIFLLLAAVLWGMLGTIESKLVADGSSTDGIAILEVEAEDVNKLAVGQNVEIDGCNGTVQDISVSSGVCRVMITAEGLPDASGTREVVVERMTPFSLVFRQGEN